MSYQNFKRSKQMQGRVAPPLTSGNTAPGHSSFLSSSPSFMDLWTPEHMTEPLGCSTPIDYLGTQTDTIVGIISGKPDERLALQPEAG